MVVDEVVLVDGDDDLGAGTAMGLTVFGDGCASAAELHEGVGSLFGGRDAVIGVVVGVAPQFVDDAAEGGFDRGECFGVEAGFEEPFSFERFGQLQLPDEFEVVCVIVGSHRTAVGQIRGPLTDRRVSGGQPATVGIYPLALAQERLEDVLHQQHEVQFVGW